eukprot:321655-Prorocentrum_minimum.AAC.1
MPPSSDNGPNVGRFLRVRPEISLGSWAGRLLARTPTLGPLSEEGGICARWLQACESAKSVLVKVCDFGQNTSVKNESRHDTRKAHKEPYERYDVTRS